jgi:flavin reductase (DIM6/NTAB) family NADH-FMN oxidoreductase RutF
MGQTGAPADLSSGFTPRDLRHAFGLFPTGVAVMTAVTAGGERLGATVSSFNSVSIDPPLVLFSLSRTARSIAAWEVVSQFAVSVLGEHQSELSTRFAKAMTDKWSGIDPLNGTLTPAPLIRDALAWFACDVWARYDGGDHMILIGRVVHLAATTSPSPRPLVFSGGKYRRLDNDAGIETPFDASQWLHGW